MTTTFVSDTSPAAGFFKTPIPAHDEPELRRSPSRVLATWPAGTFVENIHAEADGSFLVSVHSMAEIHQWREGSGISFFAALPASPTSINAHPDGGFVVLGGAVASSPQFVWRLTPQGAFSEIMRLDDALFLNGSTPFRGRHLLAVDSIRGRIHDIDLDAQTSSIWCDHELLRKVSAEPMLPGANGIKIFGRHVYVSNTDRALLLRIPFGTDGVPGDVEIVAERLRADDFVFDESGIVFLTTHIHNSVLRLTPDGTRTNIAGVIDGMAGSTAATFGATADSSASIFVTTTGGVLAPFDGVPQTAKLVRIDVGGAGHAISYLS